MGTCFSKYLLTRPAKRFIGINAIILPANFLLTGSANYSLVLFMTGFMTYYAFTFSGLMQSEINGWKLGLKLALMCFLLASIYATAMAFAGILNP